LNALLGEIVGLSDDCHGDHPEKGLRASDKFHTIASVCCKPSSNRKSRHSSRKKQLLLRPAIPSLTTEGVATMTVATQATTVTCLSTGEAFKSLKYSVSEEEWVRPCPRLVVVLAMEQIFCSASDSGSAPQHRRRACREGHNTSTTP
jgi:hypothetical protein